MTAFPLILTVFGACTVAADHRPCRRPGPRVAVDLPGHGGGSGRAGPIVAALGPTIALPSLTAPRLVVGAPLVSSTPGQQLGGALR